ncbi:protein-glutamine gamma-glutamyltransferase [Metabacillus fastidiosus]|uniref:protein-glutamine gamma-glutamyltransferase n=1 Tax=Metabacillus fastidiosus TaxID=1458 RepID=UPI0008246CEA|nr:protein-glutamine gamma-glutamyltransferase [Metabacillus fastidiosus]MED4462230.1 protein-glutamine gamma-glutamyltransferase [Metabacillus fastidiosus]
MIQVSGMPFQPSSLNVGSIEKVIIKRMSDTPVLYSYPSIHKLLFELNLRKNIIESSKAMNNSQAKFTIFQYAKCNDTYWKLTKAGGFLLKSKVSPSAAILDIYQNSSQYAFECATACIIVFYHAVLKSIGKSLFNSLFRNIYLYSWHADPDLGIYTYYANQFLPGDAVYFKNPDFNRKISWYRGVNAVAVSDGKFFGHGAGIKTAKEMIEFLNKQRRPGSNQSAYLTRLVTHPSFQHLSQLSTFQRDYTAYKKQHIISHHNKSSISFLHYLTYLQKQIRP